MLLALDADSREPVGSFIATRSGKIQSCLSGYQVMSYIISDVQSLTLIHLEHGHTLR